MSYDFKPRPSNSKQRTAAKPKGKPKSTKKALPGWLIILAIILVGSFGYGLYYIKNTPAPNKEDTTLEEVVKQATQSISEQPTSATKEKETRFEFYTLLPERDTVLPPVTERPQVVEEAPNFHYMLQAGAFKQKSDAEKRRAELILNGYEATVEATEYKNGQTWYRLLIGPFTSQSKLSKARSTLLQSNIETMVIKRKND